MSCPGIHCACCSGGIALPIVPLAGIYGLIWLADHIIEIAIVSAVCGVLAVGGSIALMRWSDRRDARRTALWRVREAPPVPVAKVAPQVSQRAAPALEQHVHYHFHAADSREAARIIRTALPGMAGDAITEGKNK